jgi:hypothetical protein
MRRSRLRILLGLLAAAIVAAGALVWAGSRSDVVAGGPLAYPEDYHDTLGFTVHLRAPYSWGLVVLRNKGDRPAVVQRITLVDQSGSLKVVGLYAVSEDTPEAVGFAPGFDPGRGRTVEGLVVPPGAGHGFQVVFGLEVDTKGVSGFRSVRVEYEVGKTRYAATLDHSVALCAPVEQYDDCPGPTDSVPVTR